MVMDEDVLLLMGCEFFENIEKFYCYCKCWKFWFLLDFFFFLITIIVIVIMSHSVSELQSLYSNFVALDS